MKMQKTYVCKDKFEDKYTKEKTFCKVRDH